MNRLVKLLISLHAIFCFEGFGDLDYPDGITIENLLFNYFSN